MGAKRKYGRPGRRGKSVWPDFHRTGPDTLAGRYMRSFWHPVYHSADLPGKRAKPITIMNVDYTLYRGESGQPHLMDARCPHRSMQLSAGWVEGESLRCFFHGWKFDSSGQCVDQPAEPRSFADKVAIGSYPCRDYLGLVFAYLGDGEPPPFPRYPTFEDFDGLIEHDSYSTRCNYFNKVENAADLTHSGFVHRNNPGSFDGLTNSPTMDAEESCWGVTVFARWPEELRVLQFGMPNVVHHKAQPSDFAIAPYREFLAWYVPVDDENTMQFTVVALRLPPDKLHEYTERRAVRLAKRTQSHLELGARVLKGDLSLDDVDPESTDFVRLQDEVSLVGQGRIADYDNELLGQSDKAVIFLRGIWARELKAFANDRACKRWVHDDDALRVTRGEVSEKQYEEALSSQAPSSGN